MDRRSALKYIGVASAAAFMLPSCISDPKKVSVALSNLKINGDEEDLLANFAGALIPKTDTPGAQEVGAHQFLLVMVDDCVGSEDQQKYVRGMRAFQDETRKITGKSFLKASVTERSGILAELESKKESLSDDVRAFYGITRNYIIQGYLSSQYFLTEVKPYKLVPGPVFQGCAPFSKS